MKRFGIALIMVMLGAGLVTACGGDDDDTCTLTADACTAKNQGFDADKCECVEQTPVACDKTEDTCKAEGKILDADKCECIDQTPVACDKTEESCKAEGKILNADKCECVDNTSSDCTKDNCKGYCLDNTCVVIGEACSEEKSVCVDNILVSCGTDIASAWEGNEDDGSLVWIETKCGDTKVCATNEKETACYEKCDTADANKFICDPDSGEDGDSLMTSFTYTCKAIGDDKLFVKTATTDCGTNYCDTMTGKCYESPAVDEKKEEGEACKEDEECYTGLCFSSVCKSPAADGEQCWDDKQCSSKSCELDSGAKSGICVSGLALGKECENSTECHSGYCDSTTGKCAKKPETGSSEVECVTSSDCKSGMCDAKLKCSTVDQPGIGSACVGGVGGKCATGLVCNAKGTCVLEAMSKNGEVCTEKSVKCDGEVLMTCDAASMGSDKTYSTEMCAKMKNGKNSRTCVENNGSAECMTYCANEGDKAIECDGEEHYYELECKKIGDKIVYVRGSYKECGNGKTCDGWSGEDKCY